MIIYKYILPLSTEFELSIPTGGRIVHFDINIDAPAIWVEIPTPDKQIPPLETRKFSICGTGWLLEDDSYTYIGTIQLNNYVWHLFEINHRSLND